MLLTCFKAYDVRGKLGDELNPAIAQRIGRAFAETLGAHRVVVGRDCRASSKDLAAGVIEQRLYQDHPPRYEYHLTDKGWDLLQFTIAMHDWGTHWIPSPHGPGLLLRHRPCGKRLRVKVVCGSCGAAVEAREVQIRGPVRRPVAQRRGGQGKKPLVRRT